MRAIDADALKEKTLAHGEKIAYVVSFIWDVDTSPTIDAIPVKWLESKRKEALHEGMRPDEVEAVKMVLWMWQKEQEARNT